MSDEETLLVSYKEPDGTAHRMKIKYYSGFVVLTGFNGDKDIELNLVTEEFLELMGNLISFGYKYKDKLNESII